MSAFIVSETVIHVATAALIAHERRPADPDALGRALWTMNGEAVRQRYRLHRDPAGQREMAGHAALVAAYRYRPVTGLSAAAICKQVDCLVYQCLEGDVPERDPLFARLEAVARALAAPLGGDARHDHPAYRAAPWGIEPCEVG